MTSRRDRVAPIDLRGDDHERGGHEDRERGDDQAAPKAEGPPPGDDRGAIRLHGGVVLGDERRLDAGERIRAGGVDDLIRSGLGDGLGVGLVDGRRRFREGQHLGTRVSRATADGGLGRRGLGAARGRRRVEDRERSRHPRLGEGPAEKRMLGLGRAPEVGLQLTELTVEIELTLLELEQLELAGHVERLECGEHVGQIDGQPHVGFGRVETGRRRSDRAQREPTRSSIANARLTTSQVFGDRVRLTSGGRTRGGRRNR